MPDWSYRTIFRPLLFRMEPSLADVFAGRNPGFAGAIGIHAAVGYTAVEHLMPVYLAVAMWAIALGLSRRYLLA